MRKRGQFLLLFIFVTAVALTLFLFLRSDNDETEYGTAVALCPGPDLYGYTCADGSIYAYIDATNNTNLFTLDGSVTLDLPFPFTFYNTTYTTINAISNGNIQFGSANLNFNNTCLYPDMADGMGAMIAPYWSDLDLSFSGALEWEIVGTAPERIFVIEWDNIPPYGLALDDTVTFEVQLFENSNDIVFLYQDVTTSLNSQGSHATIGLQTEAQTKALQFSCNQPTVNSASGLHFLHPALPNPLVKPTESISIINRPAANVQTREPLTTLLARLKYADTSVLPSLQQHWLQQPLSRFTEWIWADVTGNGRDELIILWRPNRATATHTEIAVITYNNPDEPTLLWHQILSNREQPFRKLTIIEAADLTHDSQTDILFHDQNSGQTLVVTAVSDDISLHKLPDSCNGRIATQDGNIIRTGCTTNNRFTSTWNGAEFLSP